MPYRLWLGGIQMPVAPSKLETKIKNQNKTINLIDGSEVSILKSPGLTEYNFELLIPQVNYPFADYPNNEFVNPKYYLDHFSSLKSNCKPFQLFIEEEISFREKFVRKVTNTMVSLEEYSIVEDAGNGFDYTVSMTLKQYIPCVASKYPAGSGKPDKKGKKSKPPIPKSYTVKKGDTLWGICKKFLGDGLKYPQIAKLNGIKNPNLIRIGQVIRLD
jgi:Uncharacterized protein containing LysM domain